VEISKTEKNGNKKQGNRKALTVLFLSVFIDLIGFGIIIPIHLTGMKF
jgi:hypothetical protein